ncbi:hypothetical protein A3A46_00185 [Candidatus Roizmanbacteria bacterium RIFCSPLOWO2_01_FULL_37_13]|uniref:EamA domain-containing protein n=1 Tax=Candidatus Roizmanbacteria bacterium RIFCSPHIGHO2_02_FULL_38_11 TaxID=1802039 RepID=A0A1F7H3Z8_9BACT|nr:MAG: hypothetical protein A3C25_02820 [Candidatus Roizmanbacteria bacterium RIFCSPHIGHO2_02_FULL_38_11]OGK42315.1 MAG: hypothetical protein A3A46_00185 [Candidatus Roizmanbacteria bacterium RIFCSPLOWO2_01_FULL_37_13]
MLLPLILSVIPMFSWGLIAILAAKLSRKVGGFNSGFLIQLFAFLGTLLISPLFFSIPGKINWLGLIIQGLLGAGTYIIYCKALEKGKVPIIVPIVSAWALISAVLGIVFLGEPIYLLKAVSIFIITLGIIILTINWNQIKRNQLNLFNPGVVFALMVAVGWGFSFFYLGSLSRQMGWFFTTVGTRMFVMISFFLGYISITNRTNMFQNVPWKVLFPIAALDVVAFTTYNLAVSRYDVSYVSVISSASPLVAVILGEFLLKEKTSLLQKLGIVIIIVGIIGLQF